MMGFEPTTFCMASGPWVGFQSPRNPHRSAQCRPLMRPSRLLEIVAVSRRFQPIWALESRLCPNSIGVKPSWLIALLVGFFGGLGTLLLRLPHERAAELRGRMVEAADDFVAAYVTAREATSGVNQAAGVIDSFAGEGVPPEVRRIEGDWNRRDQRGSSWSTWIVGVLPRRQRGPTSPDSKLFWGNGRQPAAPPRAKLCDALHRCSSG